MEAHFKIYSQYTSLKYLIPTNLMAKKLFSKPLKILYYKLKTHCVGFLFVPYVKMFKPDLNAICLVSPEILIKIVINT